MRQEGEGVHPRCGEGGRGAAERIDWSRIRQGVCAYRVRRIKVHGKLAVNGAGCHWPPHVAN